jgi:hypothetical protein
MSAYETAHFMENLSERIQTLLGESLLYNLIVENVSYKVELFSGESQQ